jgi:hypothetical protein
MAELKLKDFDAIQAGFAEALRENGSNYLVGYFLELMNGAKTARERRAVLRFLHGYADLYSPVAAVLDLGTEKEFEQHAGSWTKRRAATMVSFYQRDLQGCTGQAEKALVMMELKALRSAFPAFRKALSLARIPDRSEALLKSGKEIMKVH